MDQDSDTLSLLSAVDLFHGLGEAELRGAAALMRRQAHKVGQVVMQQGDPSDSLHLVESGSFEIFIWDELLRIERPLQTLRRGDVFGEMGVLTGEARSASIRCRDAGSTVSVGAAEFLDFLRGHSSAALSLARTLAHRIKAGNRARSIPFERTASYAITPEVARLLPLKLILQYRVLPLSLESTTVRLGIVDPSDVVARQSAAAFLHRYEIEWVCLAASDFDHFRDQRLHHLTASAALGADAPPERLHYPSELPSAGVEEDSDAARVLDAALRSAIEGGASDLHFEPGLAQTNVRARIDGRLIMVHPPIAAQEYRAVLSRLRVLAELDITEHRRPQDGALRVILEGRAVDLRLSIVPTPRGEAVAIRLLDSARRDRTLRRLVVSEALAEWIEGLFLQPGGLVLITGPTNSGKTTTLYAGLQMRLANDPACKLVTVEDPVEYELDGVTQVQIDERSGLTFSATLRTVLRQDPNVLLVGEMRDRDSMHIAVEAALTGHLVLSSLHTRGALETVVRLRQQGVEPFLIASCLRGVVSQRLVPRLCAACREERPADAATLRRLERAGLIVAGETPRNWVAPGCSHCHHDGIKGRVAVYEVLIVMPPLQRAIESERPESELLEAISPGSYVSLARYARHLLEQGLASADALSAIFPTQEAVPDWMAAKK
jgi:type II secretory ATPase GspE/PulE/Tfp pilus assembly ATPase PilB-like protein